MPLLSKEESELLDKNIFGEALVESMNGSEPVFITRLGGTDYDAAFEKLLFPSNIAKDFSKFLSGKICRRYYVGVMNGYFDEKNTLENYTHYLDRMIACYADGLHCTVGNIQMLNWFNSFRKAGATTRKEFLALCGRHAAGVAFIQTLDLMQYWNGASVVCPFAYIESVTPFLTYFSKFAEGKNILIASPFVESIPHQLEKNCELIRGVDYSKINFSFYETPITYNTKFADVSAIVGTSNWHEQVDLMCEEIEGLDFDIALLACGSYAMPIGAHIKNKMKKKSIYIGGPLQTFFGIGGYRYKQLLESKIAVKENVLESPLEMQKYASLIGKISNHVRVSESVNAYF